MTPKKQGLTGLFIAVVIALPLFVFSAINFNFNINKRAQGEPNFCGGTCGSNYNCQANFFCFEGFCRNPICASDTDCVCNPVTSPSTTPIVSVKPSSKSTPIQSGPTITPLPKGGIETAYPDPVSTKLPIIEFQTTSPNTTTTDDLKNRVWIDFSKYLVGVGLFIVLAITTFLFFQNHRKNKTHIMPPTNI